MRRNLVVVAIAAALSTSAFAAPHTIEAPARVMVLPFRPIGDVGSYGWIGDGVEQSLIVRAGVPGNTVLTAPPQSVNLTAPVDPVAVAKAAGASSVISGSYTLLNNDIRLNGQIVDVASGQTLGTLSATGPVRDLFKLEDNLSQQLDGVLPKVMQPTDGQVEPAPVAGTIDSYQPVYAPVSAGSYYSTPDDSYYPRYYSAAYDSGYYNDGYPDYGYDYGLPFYSGFYFGSAYGYGYGYGDRYGHYHSWNGHHFVDRGSFGHGSNYGNYYGHGTTDHGFNNAGHYGNGGRGFAPVGTIVGGRSYTFGNGGVVAGGSRSYAVSHAGFETGSHFAGGSDNHGFASPGGAVGGGGGFSVGGSGGGNPGGFGVGGGTGGGFAGGGHAGGAGGGGHR